MWFLRVQQIGNSSGKGVKEKEGQEGPPGQVRTRKQPQEQNNPGLSREGVNGPQILMGLEQN